MPITSAVLKDNATAIAPTGGSDITIASLGLSNAILNTYVSNDTSMLTRRTLSFSSKDPKVNAGSPGGYTQARRKITLVSPRSITVGTSTVLTQDKVTIEIATDVSATNAQINNLRYLAAQVLGYANFDNFFQAGALV